MALVTVKPKHTVHVASEILGVSSDTIRRWEKKGLIKAHRGEHGERLFDEEELRRVATRSTTAVGEWTQLKATPGKTTLIELFCGAGGLALGLHNAGLDTKLLVDFDKDTIATLNHNRPKWNAICKSVADLDLSEYAGQIDVMAGGFPCQAFSYAGKGRGFEDTRGTLFYEYARLIQQVQPKVVIGENVKGLLNHDNGKTLSTMLRVLDELGYDVSYRVLRSQFLDVPQKRERLIILGTRKDLKLKRFFPQEKDYIVPLSEAIADAPKSDGQTYTAKKHAVMELVPEGGYWRDLPDEIQKTYMGASYFLGGGKTGMARRLSWSEPSLTLTCNPAQKQTERCHPSETRPLNIREYARIQCFPDDWEFMGSQSSQYKQIGNAVPVNLGYHVGLAVRAMLNDEPKKADKPAILLEAPSVNEDIA